MGDDFTEEITFVLNEEYKFKGEGEKGWRFSRLKSDHRTGRVESLRIGFVCNLSWRPERAYLTDFTPRAVGVLKSFKERVKGPDFL